MAIKSVEDLFDEVNRRGWLVLNLCQISKDSWRCNLQKRTANGGTSDVFTEFADAPTPHEALSAAIRNTEAARNKRAGGSEADTEVVKYAALDPFKVLALAEALTASTAARKLDTAGRKA